MARGRSRAPPAAGGRAGSSDDFHPSPWPRLADAWWVYLLGAVELVLFPSGLVARVRCSVGQCSSSWLERAVDLDAIGGLPRLLITGLFAGIAVLGWQAARRRGGPERIWWTAIAGVGVVLAVAKLWGPTPRPRSDSMPSDPPSSPRTQARCCWEP